MYAYKFVDFSDNADVSVDYYPLADIYFAFVFVCYVVNLSRIY